MRSEARGALLKQNLRLLIPALVNKLVMCRALRQAETLPELLNALNDLRKALAIEKSQFSTQGAEWEEQMRRCIESNASIEDVLQLLSELRVSAKQWNKPKQKEPVAAVDCSKDQKV